MIEGGCIWIESVRQIAVGEGLAYDYAYILEERDTPAAKRRYIPATAERRSVGGRSWAARTPRQEGDVEIPDTLLAASGERQRTILGHEENPERGEG